MRNKIEEILRIDFGKDVIQVDELLDMLGENRKRWIEELLKLFELGECHQFTAGGIKVKPHCNHNLNQRVEGVKSDEIKEAKELMKKGKQLEKGLKDIRDELDRLSALKKEKDRIFFAIRIFLGKY